MRLDLFQIYTAENTGSLGKKEAEVFRHYLKEKSKKLASLKKKMAFLFKVRFPLKIDSFRNALTIPEVHPAT